MWKIAVCDDEKSTRDQVCRLLKRLTETHGTEFEIARFSSGEDLVRDMAPDTDLLILDISMGALNGINAAHLLREKGCRSTIIFLTTMVQYALQGYEVHAFSFIQKPLKPQHFERVVLDALALCHEKKDQSIVLQRGRVKDTLTVRSIIYIETFDHTSQVVSTRGAVSYNLSLNYFAEKLSGYGFGFCHRSYLVNYLRIKRIEACDLYMDNGDCIPISKHRRKDFLEDYTRFMGAQI